MSHQTFVKTRIDSSLNEISYLKKNKQKRPNLSRKRMDFCLPKEIWLKIWSDLDFQTRQKTCVLVCKEWFDGIRADGRLSGQLFLENDEIEDADAEAILSKWENLKILRLSKNLDHLDLSITHKFLKKVIVPKVPAGYQIVGMDVFKGYPVFDEAQRFRIPVLVKKICFNPHDKVVYI